MIDINKEAKEYSDDIERCEDGLVEQCFIAGANSKYVQAKILQAKIDILQYIRDKCTIFELDNMDNTLDNIHYKTQNSTYKITIKKD